MKAVLAGFNDSETTQETENTTQITRENTQRSENTTQETHPKGTTQEKIIDLLKTQPLMTQRDLSDKIGISSNGIKYHLTRLKSAGRIRHVGPTKAGRWEVLK
jgi:ATP-dependent DNA helicase RecG